MTDPMKGLCEGEKVDRSLLDRRQERDAARLAALLSAGDLDAVHAEIAARLERSTRISKALSNTRGGG